MKEKEVTREILHTYEKIEAEIFDDPVEGSEVIADIIIKAINDHSKGPGKDRLFKLGLTTGTTPVSLYNWLASKYKGGEVSFRNVEIFSIDEYYPVSADAPQSRNRRLHDALIDKVDVLRENVHIPDGTVPRERISEYCREFDRRARGMDILVVGMGEQGQIGFNDAGCSEKSATRTVMMTYKNRKRQARK